MVVMLTIWLRKMIGDYVDVIVLLDIQLSLVG